MYKSRTEYIIVNSKQQLFIVLFYFSTKRQTKTAMKRKHVYIGIFTTIFLIIWFYWSSESELKTTVANVEAKYKFFERHIITPQSAACIDNVMVILVTSYVGHVELRSAHRRAMPPEFLKSINITRVFLLAKIPDKEKFITQAAIRNESNKFSDILQGSFIENYRNLTYKHLMGLHWASTVCQCAKFILKVDDDIVYNLNKSLELIKNLNISDRFIMGYMLNKTKPKRNKDDKWYVSLEEYSRQEYPTYLSGWYYITTPKTALSLYDESMYHPYFWIDDIFVTGLLVESLGIKLLQVPINYWLEYYELLECCLTDMIQKSIQCDYAVGPNGNRNKLIAEFTDALQHCSTWKNCTLRPKHQPLKESCVAYRERNIFSNGIPEIQYLRLK